jgi:hypothetical protein
VIDQRVEDRRLLLPVHAVPAGGVPPAFVAVPAVLPSIEHVEEVVDAAIAEQARRVADVTLKGRVVELRPQWLIEVLVPRHFDGVDVVGGVG